MASLYLDIVSYLRVNEAFHRFVAKHNMDAGRFLDTETWVMIFILSVLVAIILVGLVLIFIYYQKMIQLYRMQQNFINGFTHELKTPIASLKLYLETLERHDHLPIDKKEKVLKYMNEDVLRLSENVSMILNLGQIEEKKLKHDFESLELKNFFKEMIERHPQKKDIDLRAQENVKLEVNRELFEMMCLNLISNAFHHNHSVNPQLEVRVWRENQNIFISFKDNGLGVKKNERKKIFRKFYQSGKSIKGSGIGLYVVSLICRIHRGKIHVQSEGQNLGSVFELKFKQR